MSNPNKDLSCVEIEKDCRDVLNASTEKENEEEE